MPRSQVVLVNHRVSSVLLAARSGWSSMIRRNLMSRQGRLRARLSSIWPSGPVLRVPPRAVDRLGRFLESL